MLTCVLCVLRRHSWTKLLLPDAEDEYLNLLLGVKVDPEVGILGEVEGARS